MAKRKHLELGTGLNQLNPRKNFQLAEEIIDGYELYVKLKTDEKRSDRKVTLIGRALPNNNVALYRYAFVDGKKKLESTGKVLKSETDTRVKNANKEILRIQRNECEKLAVALRDGNTTFKPTSRKNRKVLLADYCESLVTVFKESFARHLKGLAKHLRIYNASLRVVDVDDEVIKDFIQYLKNRAVSLNWKSKDDAPHLADNTQAGHVSMLSMVLNQAVRDKLLANNPCYLIPKGIRPQKDNERRTYLTPKEVAKLMAAKYPCKKANTKQDTPKAFFFSVFTGLRFSDVVALTGNNVYEDENGTYIKFIVEKTGKEQTLYLNEMALQYLPRHKDKKQPLFDDIPSNYQTNNELRRWSAAAGIDYKKVTFHVARHSYATIALNSGESLEEVANQLGHSSTRVTSIYAKVMHDTQRKATNKMASFFKEQTAKKE